MASEGRPGRPRDQVREMELLLATQELLAEVGYDLLTVDKVASRCGAGKSTIYRRWSSKQDLVADAVALIHNETPIPDSGDLRTDLILLASAWHNASRRRDAAVAGLLTAMRRDARLRNIVACKIGEPRHAAFKVVVQQAIVRGEVAPDVDIELLSKVLPAMTFHHVTVHAKAVQRPWIEQIVDRVLLPALTAGK
jgi:AcrR family transcriptional regulator